MNQLHNSALEKLFELAVVTSEYMEQGMTVRGLSRPRATVLWLLNEHGPQRQRDLAETIGVSPRNVTGLVDALERDGFATREPHPNDRRATLISLTPKGKTTMTALRTEYDAGATRLFADLPQDALTTFITTADHLLTRIHQEPR